MANTRTNGFTDTELVTGYQPDMAALAHAQRSKEEKDLYHLEKHLGLRRPNGALKLKKLNARHQRILALHLTGKYSNVRIARDIGCSAMTVSRVLNDPLALRVINNYHSTVEMDLKAMLPLAVDAVRDGLQDGDTELRLKAVDRFEKMTGRSEKKESEGVNVSISFVNSVRDQFFNDIREAAEVSGVLEPAAATRLDGGQPTDVEFEENA